MMFYTRFLTIIKVEFICFLVTLNSIASIKGPIIDLENIEDKNNEDEYKLSRWNSCKTEEPEDENDVEIPESKFTFNIEWFHQIQKKIEANRKRIREHYFHLLGPIARKELCEDVKNFASLDGFSSENIELVDEYSVVLLDKQTIEFSIAIRCPTIPESYILDRDSNHEMTIMMKENKYEKGAYKFLMKKVESEPKPNFDDEDVKKNYLSSLLQDHRLLICVAVKKNISENISIVLNSHKVEKAQLFEIEYQPGQKEEKIAIKCPSSPKMYAYLGKLPTEIEAVIIETAA